MSSIRRLEFYLHPMNKSTQRSKSVNGSKVCILNIVNKIQNGKYKLLVDVESYNCIIYPVMLLMCSRNTGSKAVISDRVNKIVFFTYDLCEDSKTINYSLTTKSKYYMNISSPLGTADSVDRQQQCAPLAVMDVNVDVHHVRAKRSAIRKHTPVC